MTNHNPLDTHEEERARNEKIHRDRLRRESEDADFKWLMGSKRGRRIVWRQLEQAGVFRSSFNTNAMQMAFSEGNRNGGLHILAQIHTVCPELYQVMIKEQANDRLNVDE